jgi:DNA-binding transcriptional LysR family regulator
MRGRPGHLPTLRRGSALRIKNVLLVAYCIERTFVPIAYSEITILDSVVVSVEELACLDTLIWLRSGSAAAARLGVTQSTISRRVNQIANLFHLRFFKPNGEWETLGDQTILNLERMVHQRYRWEHGMPLRIEAQYFSGPLFCDPSPEGWTPGNFDFMEIKTPLRLLRTGVIDAWIGTYPDVPDADDQELACFHLTRLPTHLVVAVDHPLLALGERITLDDVRHYPSFALPDHAFPRMQHILQQLGLWNLQVPLRRYSHEKWEGRMTHDLRVGYANAFTLHLFPEPHVVLPIQIPLETGDSLIVLRRYAEHRRLQALLACLTAKAAQLAEQFSDLQLVGGA